MAMRTTTTAARRAANARDETHTSPSEAPVQQASRASVLRACTDVCNETMTYCLEKGGDHADVEHIRCLVDTAELCTLTANAIARESDHTKELLELCADVCGCTAECCAEFEDDAQLKACEEACREAFEFANRS